MESISTHIKLSSSARKTSGETCSRTLCLRVAARCSRACVIVCRKKCRLWLPRTCFPTLTLPPIENIARGWEALFSPQCPASNQCSSRNQNTTRKEALASFIANASDETAVAHSLTIYIIKINYCYRWGLCVLRF